MSKLGNRLKDLDDRSGLGVVGDLVARWIVPWCLVFALVAAGVGVAAEISGDPRDHPTVAFAFAAAALGLAGLIKLVDRHGRPK